jgi:hypothetical protein
MNKFGSKLFETLAVWVNPIKKYYNKFIHSLCKLYPFSTNYNKVCDNEIALLTKKWQLNYNTKFYRIGLCESELIKPFCLNLKLIFA